jgi:hypothetical protein
MLRSRSLPRRLGGAALTALAVALAGSGAGGTARDALRLPPIVLVSRAPVAGAPGAVPGLGPHQRDVVTGGRLLLRAPDGAVRELAPGTLRDASDPSVSPDGRRVLFAGVRAGRDEGWRLFLYELASDRLDTTLVVAGPAFDPCWISDSAAVVVRVDPGATGQYRDAPVTQLWVMRIPPGAATPVRITSERNGAEEPAWDATTGRIVYARWWYNRWRPSDDPATRGVTFEPDRAIGDSVNLWQIVSVRPDGSGARVEASGLTSRLASMGTQPAVLADGSIVATCGANLGLSPAPGALGLQRFAPRIGGARRVAGALIETGPTYGTPHGLAAPGACAAAALPDGRVLFSYDPGTRGDYGLYVMQRDGSRIEKVIDLPGTLELDAAPVVARRGPWARPVTTGATAGATFRFFDRDVFGGGHARPGIHAAPTRTAGARIRFWTTVARVGGAPGDSAVLLREVPVRADGSVDQALPADLAMFEQLVDADGRVLRSADGPAHVAGFNSGRAGATAACVGCHTGHSTIVVKAPR